MKLKNPELKNIHTIIFDFGNVLLDIDLNLTMNALHELGIIDINPQNIHPQNSGIFLQSEVGAISTDTFLETLRQQSTLTPKPSKEQVLAAWNALLLPYDYKRFEMVEELRKNYTVILLSNTNKPHHDFFEQRFADDNHFAGKTFRECFDTVYYSDEIRLRKPDVAIYRTIQNLKNLNPGRTLFIDDTAENLIEPRKLGWSTYHLQKPETVLDLFA